MGVTERVYSLSPVVAPGERLRVAPAVDSNGSEHALYVLNRNDVVVASVPVMLRHNDIHWDMALIIADALETFSEAPRPLPERSSRE